MRIFMFDPCFGRMSGHWENYCKRFYHELTQQNHHVTVYGQKQPTAAIIAGVNFKPLFQHLPFVDLRTFEDLDSHAKLYLTDLKEIPPHTFQDGDLLIFHSIFPQILSAIIQWTGQLVQDKKIKVALFFQFSPGAARVQLDYARRFYYFARDLLQLNNVFNRCAWVDELHVQYYRYLADKLKPLVRQGSHSLFTSTKVLSDNFTKLFKIDVENLPMPGPILEIPTDEEVLNNQQEKICIGYFGHSSLEKGGQFLKYIVDKTKTLYPLAKFILHINPNKDLTHEFTKFKAYDDEDIECHFGHIEEHDLLQLIKRSQIILMPYLPAKYATTPSAIFSEALPFKKVFVLPKGTWAYHEAVRYRAGFVAFKKYTADDILQAVLRALLKYDELKARSLNAGKSYYDLNNITAYTHLFTKKMQQHLLT